MKLDLISIVVPCFNEQEVINLFYDEICKVSKEMSGTNFEFIFVDDGSNDDTLNILKSLSGNDERVQYISFSRNFGKEAAMYAGFEAAKGDFVGVMDVDMQDPPSLLPQMYELLKSGEYDTVASRRVSREGEPPIRSLFARAFYKIINKISKTEIVDGARDFRLMTKQVAQSVCAVKEYNRFSKGIFGWVGYRTKWLEYTNVERAAGYTKWSFWKLFIYSIDGITAFSTMPLSIAAIIGILCCALAFVVTIFIIVRAAIWGDPVSGWPSTVSIILFVGGMQLFTTGILGQYLAKMYMEVKKRPIYIIKEQSGLKNSD